MAAVRYLGFFWQKRGTTHAAPFTAVLSLVDPDRSRLWHMPEYIHRCFLQAKILATLTVRAPLILQLQGSLLCEFQLSTSHRARFL